MNNSYDNVEEFDIDVDIDNMTTSPSQLPLFGDTFASNNYVQTGTSTISNGTSGNIISTSGTTLGNSNSGSLWVSPTTTTTPSNNWIWTTPITNTGTGNITINNAPTNNNKYAVFELPRNKIPEAVYVAGRMITLGFLGTDVECAFVGDKLIFSPGVLSNMTYNDRITLILQYANVMYHYKVHHNFGLIEMLPESNIVKTTQLSEIKREKNVQTR